MYEGVGCARQQSEAARNDSRGVFVMSKLRASSTKNSQNRTKIGQLFHFTRGSLVRWQRLHLRKSGFHQAFAVLQADVLSLLGTWPKHLRKRTFRSRESCTSLGPKRGKKGLKSSGFLFICIISPETSKYGSWLCIPYSLFKSYAYVAETPTRVCLTTFS